LLKGQETEWIAERTPFQRSKNQHGIADLIQREPICASHRRGLHMLPKNSRSAGFCYYWEFEKDEHSLSPDDRIGSSFWFN